MLSRLQTIIMFAIKQQTKASDKFQLPIESQNMCLTVIDEHGKIWDSSLIHIRRSFGSVYENAQFSEFVVRNLGFIAINQYSTSCQVRVRPSIVGTRSLKSLTAYLDALQPKRLALSFYDEKWQFELHKSPRDVIQKLIELMIALRSEQPSARAIFGNTCL